MNPPKKASRAAVELIERFEGFRRAAARLDDGRWTIGYGHTKFARHGLEVSEAEAETFLLYDLGLVTQELNRVIYTPITQNQFDALAAFAFNIGLDNFRRSHVLRRINEGQLLKAAYAMEMWRRADFEGERIVIDALVRRRAAEKTLFLTPPDGFLPAPTAVLRPQLDSDIAFTVPADKPVELTTPLNGERAAAERVAVAEPSPQPSASEAAMDAVITRLQSIPAEAAAQPRIETPLAPEPEAEPETPAPSPVEPEPEPQAYAEPEPQSEPEPSFALTPPPSEAAQPQETALYGHSAVETGEESAPLFPSEPISFDDYDGQRVAHHEFDMAEIEHAPADRQFGLSPVARWIVLMAVGLIVFAGAILWGFKPGQVLIAVVLGIIGIGCVATAVYFLLERLGGREEQ